MTILFIALGGAMLIEGAVYALFPGAMKRAMGQVMNMPEDQLRKGGLGIAIAGFILMVMVVSRM